jgi:branched-chain amino acid transport system permease protein
MSSESQTIHLLKQVSVHLRYIAILSILIGLILVNLFLKDMGLLGVTVTVLMYITLAQAWNILGGYGGYLNFGMAAFFGLGTYTTSILFDQFRWSPFITAPLGGLVAVFYGLVVGIPSLRLRGSYFAILTLVTTFVVKYYVYVVKFTKGAIGIYIQTLPFDMRTNNQIFYYIYLGLAVLTTLVVYLVERSRFGHALVAIREDEDAAEILGVSTIQVKNLALLLGACFAGIAGGFYSARIGYIEPEGVFNFSISIDVILMTIIGGSGTWQGPLIGVPVVMFLSELLRVGITKVQLFGTRVPLEFNRMIFGFILVLVALYAKKGIMGFFRRKRGKRFSV